MLGKTPAEGNGNAHQYSCLENPMDRGAWRAALHRSPRVRPSEVTERSTVRAELPRCPHSGRASGNGRPNTPSRPHHGLAPGWTSPSNPFNLTSHSTSLPINGFCQGILCGRGMFAPALQAHLMLAFFSHHLIAWVTWPCLGFSFSYLRVKIQRKMKLLKRDLRLTL